MAEQLAATPRGGIDINTLDTNDNNDGGRHRAENPGSVAVADIIARVQRERQAEAELGLQDMAEEEQTELERKVLRGAPEGFVSSEVARTDEAQLGRGKLGLFRRARLMMGLPNRLYIKGMSWLMDRRARNEAEFNGLSDDDKERRRKKITTRAILGATAVLSAVVAQKAGAAIDAFDPMQGSVPADKVPEFELAVGMSELNNATEFIYDPSRDVFNSSSREGFDFRAALDASSAEAAVKDLTEGWKTNPLQFAATLGAFGVIENTQESIEATAQQMLKNPESFASHYEQVQAMIDPSAASIDPPFRGAYGTYGMYKDDAGHQRLVYDNSVYDPQQILTIQTPNGPVCYGLKCGQVVNPSTVVESVPVVDMSEGDGLLPAPATVYAAAPTQTSEQPWGGAPIPDTPAPAPAPMQPSAPVVPVPPAVTTPTPPSIPEITPPSLPPIELPPVLTPKGEAYPSDQWDVPLGPGEYMPEPVEVETEVITPVERPGIDQEPIVDSFTEPEAAETGGSAPGTTTGGLDTSGNSGPSELEDASTKADSSNTTGGSSSSSSGAGETSSSNQTSETGTVESR